jgi:hypothetical protein
MLIITLGVFLTFCKYFCYINISLWSHSFCLRPLTHMNVQKLPVFPLIFSVIENVFVRFRFPQRNV